MSFIDKCMTNMQKFFVNVVLDHGICSILASKEES